MPNTMQPYQSKKNNGLTLNQWWRVAKASAPYVRRAAKYTYGKYKSRSYSSGNRNSGRSKLRSNVGYFQGVGLPDKLHLRMRYAHQFLKTTTTNGVSSLSIVNNSLRDPLGADSTIHPRYFDQLVSDLLYNRTQVKALHYKITAINHDIENEALVQIAHRDKDYAKPTSAGSLYGDQEYKNTRTIVLGPSGTDKAQKVISGSVRPWTILGLTKAQYMTDKIYSGTSSSGPNQEIFTYINTSAIPTKNDGSEISLMVELTFSVLLNDLANDVGRSSE